MVTSAGAPCAPRCKAGAGSRAARMLWRPDVILAPMLRQRRNSVARGSVIIHGRVRTLGAAVMSGDNGMRLAQSHHRRAGPQASATPTTRGSAPASPRSCSTSPRSPRSTCAAAGRARARPPCSIRRRRSSASTPSRSPAARLSASMPPPACRPGCASRAAASRSAAPACRSCRRDPVRPAQRRRQGLGPLPALPRARLRRGGGRRPRLRARQRRRRARRHHRQPQGRPRLGLGA